MPGVVSGGHVMKNPIGFGCKDFLYDNEKTLEGAIRLNIMSSQNSHMETAPR